MKIIKTVTFKAHYKNGVSIDYEAHLYDEPMIWAQTFYGPKIIFASEVISVDWVLYTWPLYYVIVKDDKDQTHFTTLENMRLCLLKMDAFISEWKETDHVG